MERMAWTDERLDDLSRNLDAGFTRIDADLRELRGEIGGLRKDLRGEMAAQGSELRGEIATLGTELRGEMALQGSELQGEIATLGTELRAEMRALRLTLLRVGGGIMIGLVGVIGAVLVSA